MPLSASSSPRAPNARLASSTPPAEHRMARATGGPDVPGDRAGGVTATTNGTSGGRVERAAPIVESSSRSAAPALPALDSAELPVRAPRARSAPAPVGGGQERRTALRERQGRLVGTYSRTSFARSHMSRTQTWGETEVRRDTVAPCARARRSLESEERPAAR